MVKCSAIRWMYLGLVDPFEFTPGSEMMFFSLFPCSNSSCLMGALAAVRCQVQR